MSAVTLHTSMRISWIVLTHDRRDLLERMMAHNVAHAGCHIDELIWVDNGSDAGVHEVMRAYDPAVSILNKVNLGVAKGWNRGLALATGDYVVSTDSDMLLPSGWLATFRTYLAGIPRTGVACFF